MAFYFLPSSIVKRASRVVAKLNFYTHPECYKAIDTLRALDEVYRLCKTEYLGFGAVLQFIPGTNAFRARHQLSIELTAQLQKIRVVLDNHYFSDSNIKQSIFNKPYREYLKDNLHLTESQYVFFNSTMKWLEDIVQGSKYEGILHHEHDDYISVFFRFPIFFNVMGYASSGKLSVLRPLINPLYILDQCFEWLHYLAHFILNIGTSPGSKSSLPRMILKGIMSAVIGLIQLPIKTLRHVIDLPIDAVKLVFLDPVFTVIKNTFEFLTSTKYHLVATAEDLQEVRALRKKVSKNIKTDAKNSSKEYFGMTVEERLYSDETGKSETIRKDRLIAVQGTKKQIQFRSELLSIVSFYKAKNKIASEDGEAIKRARSLYIKRH